MLRYTSKLAKDPISKNPIISEVYLKKIRKFLLRHQIFGLEATLLLVPFLDQHLAEKQGSKKDLIWPIGLDSFKMVFIILVETIAIKV